MENTGNYNLVRDGNQQPKTRENRFQDVVPKDQPKNESSSSDDQGGMNQKVPVKQRRDTSLAREMVEDVNKVRKNFRNLTPQNCRITFGIKPEPKDKKDVLILEQADESKKYFEYEEPLPRFKSAKNTPYKEFEKQRLLDNAFRIKEANIEAAKMNLKNETTLGPASSRQYQADIDEEEDDTIVPSTQNAQLQQQQVSPDHEMNQPNT